MQQVETETNRNSSNHLLRRDVRFLGTMLGDVLVRHGGKDLLGVVEKIREMSKSLRAQFDESAFQDIKNTITELEPDIRHQVVRAFALYFQLVNIAEQNHRIRRKRDYERAAGNTIQPGSIENVIAELQSKQISAKDVQSILEEISLELVMTAHPTEASRRSVLDIQQRISTDVMKLDDPTLTLREREALNEKLFNEVLTLWQTDEIRDRKPTVIDEVRNGLYYFDATLFHVLPDVYQEVERCLQKYYPDELWHVPTFLRFGSWIGGDRDGNPSVKPATTWETLRMHRELIIKKYVEQLRCLMEHLSFSKTIIEVTSELIDSIEQDQQLVTLQTEAFWRNEKEPYRMKVTYMLEKIQNTTNQLTDENSKYNNAEEFIEDLRIMDRSLRNHHADYLADDIVQKLIRQVELFGFHLAALDIRQHSKEHEQAMTEILAKMDIVENYSLLSEEDKIKLLTELLYDPRPLTSPFMEYSESTQESLQLYETIKAAQQEFGVRCIHSYLISMTQGASDLLEVLILGKEKGLYQREANGDVTCTFQPVPLFETIDDLHAAPQIIDTLFQIPAYKDAVKSQNMLQEIMLGYSDSNKDGGAITANWELRLAQTRLTDTAKQNGVLLKFFHGRGGALGRGGMPLYNSILTQPPSTLGGGIKITEQGEVLSQRYSLQGIAYRSLERATSALITAAMVARTPQSNANDEQQWEAILENISETAQTKYQDMILRDPDFLTFFKEATPLIEIGELNIGSRPSKRKNSDKFEDLRAIPWVFSWTQSRFLLPAWYAAGTALQSFYQNKEENLFTLQNMYQNWSFFRSAIDNLQMAVAKADLLIAKEYTTLIKDQDIAKRLFDMIHEEFTLTCDLILKVTGQQEILDYVPVIQESIRLRNPYVDPLSYMQIELLKELRELRELSKDDPILLREVLLTINGIAAGLRNTG